uniref:Uncharacterized protein n=1 Tax=Oryza meridionalis TaxID=40149 RepID=A0A0E0CEJ0_9ORYZ
MENIQQYAVTIFPFVILLLTVVHCNTPAYKIQAWRFGFRSMILLGLGPNPSSDSGGDGVYGGGSDGVYGGGSDDVYGVVHV